MPETIPCGPTPPLLAVMSTQNCHIEAYFQEDVEIHFIEIRNASYHRIYVRDFHPVVRVPELELYTFDFGHLRATCNDCSLLWDYDLLNVCIYGYYRSPPISSIVSLR
jgi:hypothetical protein